MVQSCDHGYLIYGNYAVSGKSEEPKRQSAINYSSTEPIPSGVLRLTTKSGKTILADG
jgi:hypothetical protein